MKKKILLLIGFLIFFTYFIMVFSDYYRASKSLEPNFCYKTETYKYDDGITTEYKCLIYTVYKYERESINAFEFGYFIKQRGQVNE